MDRWLHLVCQELTLLVSPRPVCDHSRATGLIDRHRHIDATLSRSRFPVGITRDDGSIATVRDRYKVFIGDDIADSDIRQWTTPQLIDLLVDLVDDGSVELGRTESSLGGRYGRFRDVLVPDATICTLWPESVEDCPGFGNDPAQATLHLVESLASVAPVLPLLSTIRSLGGVSLLLPRESA